MANAAGGKNKKYGRNAKRPSAIRYKAENREAKNKARNIKRAAVQRERNVLGKNMVVQRGTTRFTRRRSAEQPSL